MPDDLKNALEEFARFGRSLKGDEKSEAQPFLDHFFRALGHAGVIEAGATFEFRVANTEMGDLVGIVNSNWSSFEDLLHDIDWVRQIFKALERSRNVIMHSGQLSMDDIERVGVFIRDWLRQVGG